MVNVIKLFPTYLTLLFFEDVQYRRFHFVSSKEMFDKIEDFIIASNIDYVRIYNNYENIKEAYKV